MSHADSPSLLGAGLVAIGAFLWTSGQRSRGLEPIFHESLCTCDTELRTILDLKDQVDWWKWLVAVLVAILLVAAALGLCVLTSGCLCLWRCCQARAPARAEVPCAAGEAERRQEQPQAANAALQVRDVAVPEARSRARALRG